MSLSTPGKDSTDEKETSELEVDEEEPHRECDGTVEGGDSEGGLGSSATTGVIHVGTQISSAIMVKIRSSASLSFSSSCWARVLVRCCSAPCVLTQPGNYCSISAWMRDSPKTVSGLVKVGEEIRSTQMLIRCPFSPAAEPDSQTNDEDSTDENGRGDSERGLGSLARTGEIRVGAKILSESAIMVETWSSAPLSFSRSSWASVFAAHAWTCWPMSDKTVGVSVMVGEEI
jgi:hypothetical protein